MEFSSNFVFVHILSFSKEIVLSPRILFFPSLSRIFLAFLSVRALKNLGKLLQNSTVN